MSEWDGLRRIYDEGCCVGVDIYLAKEGRKERDDLSVLKVTNETRVLHSVDSWMKCRNLGKDNVFLQGVWWVISLLQSSRCCCCCVWDGMCGHVCIRESHRIGIRSGYEQ